MNQADLIWTFVSFALTVLVLSYLLGDNPFFRFATALFVGVVAGYVAVITLYNVIWPKLLLPLFFSETPIFQKALLYGIPLILSLLLLAKLFPRLARVGNGAMAYLVGVSAAVLIGGAVMGTLFPQVQDTINFFDLRAIPAGGSPLSRLLEGGYILVGAATTLIYFHFGAMAKAKQPGQRAPIIEMLGGLGQIFIAITLGSLFAGVYIASLTALVERIHFLWNTLGTLFI